MPAMSKCAQGVSFSMKRCRNCAAVIDPPSRGPIFFMSQIGELISLSYSGPSGRRHNLSPTCLPAVASSSARLSSLANIPPYSLPNAMIIAPVRVARSTIREGLKVRCVQVSASHNTSRPSASVLSTSIVCPLIEVTMSPGRCALPSGIFSTSPTTPTMLALALRFTSASIAPATAPDPPMSHFISHMPTGGFNEMPPVSNVTPLPTNAIGASPSLPPFHLIASIREG